MARKSTTKSANRISASTVKTSVVASPWSAGAVQARLQLVRAKIAAFFATIVGAITAAKISYTPILVVLLIVAAYFIGSLRTEVSYLKKEASTPNVQVAAANTTASAAPVATPTPGPLAAVTNDEHIRGDKNAKVTLVEYSDFECPFCKQFQPTLQQIMQDYNGKVRLVYRHFPLPFHQNAQKEAEASECVTELGGNDAFWQFNDKIFERTTSNGLGFSLDKLGPLAAEIGVDQTAFQNCLDSGKYTKKVQDEETAGQATGVQGTPTMYIVAPDGSKSTVPGALPYDQLKPQLDAAVQKS